MKRFIFSDSARTDQIVRCGDSELVFLLVFYLFGFLLILFLRKSFLNRNKHLGWSHVVGSMLRYTVR